MNRSRSERDWLALHLAPGIGLQSQRRILAQAGSAEALLQASRPWFRQQFGPVRGPRWHRALHGVDVDRVLDACASRGQRVLTPGAPDWPGTRLLSLHAPPAALFLAGTLPGAGTPVAAIVGTRAATAYGLGVAERLAIGLAERGVWVVSGFAAGIDGAAHTGALAAEGGLSLGVLGTGLDVDYPAANAHLRARMVARGGLLSEYPPGTPGAPHRFPQRNRLVAGIANAVVVIEAPFRSGALITARLATGNCPVLAVPGHIRRPNQAGCHALIRSGADLCRGLDDVLEALGLSASGTSEDVQVRAAALTGPPRTLYEELDLDEALDMDTLCLRTRLGPGEVTLALTTLELEGLATRIPGVGYVRR